MVVWTGAVINILEPEICSWWVNLSLLEKEKTLLKEYWYHESQYILFPKCQSFEEMFCINLSWFPNKWISDSEYAFVKAKTNEAFKKGIFGAPTFLVKEKIFWGQDRLQYAVAEAIK